MATRLGLAVWVILLVASSNYATARTTHEFTSWLIAVDSNGTELRHRDYGPPHSVWGYWKQTCDGGFILFGMYTEQGDTLPDVRPIVLSVDRSGTERWRRVLLAESRNMFTYGRGLIEIPSGGFLLDVAGSNLTDNGSGYRWLYLLNHDGDVIWTQFPYAQGYAANTPQVVTAALLQAGDQLYAERGLPDSLVELKLPDQTSRLIRIQRTRPTDSTDALDLSWDSRSWFAFPARYPGFEQDMCEAIFPISANEFVLAGYTHRRYVQHPPPGSSMKD
jgi:hypothetical protein